MFGAPCVPKPADIGFGALLKRRRLGLDFRGLGLRAPGPALLDNVYAGGVAVALHSEAGGITRKPRILERNILERAQPVPSLLAIEPVTEAPVLRVSAGDDQVKAFAIGILAGLRFAFDVEWSEFSSHVFLQKTVRQTHGQKLRSSL